jgi:hypothetical protein
VPERDLLAGSPDVDRRRVLGRTSLEAARRPLEGTRIHHLWLLAHWTDFADAADVSKATRADTTT